MINKNTFVMDSFIILFIVVLTLFLSPGNSYGLSCYNQNITLTNSSGFICTYQWVTVEGPVSLISKNISAKGLFINNTFNITGNSTLNISKIINKGNATINATLFSGNILENYGTLTLEKPIFINFSYLLNTGLIIDKNYLNNGGYPNAYASYNGNGYGCGGRSYPFSYAGSGGGSLANYSACDGGNTLVKGGTGQITSFQNHVEFPIINSSGYHVYSTLSNYSFNLSLLSSAGGASYNGVNNSSFFMRGSSGVLPLIIISRSFNNTGIIYNQGQSINYSTIKNASKFLAFGIVGASGGGVIQVISGSFINNGTFNVSGGRIYLDSSFKLPNSYTISNIGYGGNGNVFLFKANNRLLLDSIQNYTSDPANQNNYNLNYPANYSNKTQNHQIMVKVQSPLGCSLNGIYVNLKGNYNNNSFFEKQPLNNSVFLINNSIKNPYLYLSGNNPLIHYYNNLQLIISNSLNTSIETFNLTKYLLVNLSFEGGQNLSFDLLNGNYTLFSGTTLSKPLLLRLEQGDYQLLLKNGLENYTYNMYVTPNCLGYQNITILPGKTYYLYDSLNISSVPFTVYKTNTITDNITSYRDVNSCDFNISELIGLDKVILNSIYSMNSSISVASNNKVNYSSILNREINYTNYILKQYNTKSSQNPQNAYLNQSGLNLLSYYNNGNFTKEVFQINNNGTINLSYGINKSLQIVITKGTQQNFFVSTEKDIIKVFSYVPSLFLGFLGGL
ncbi:hypothetical protein M1558_04225 [Candidatus Parvarchaeota archaeon]|nr:hypothetical protein [Candidatus Parvarchaeota archaeon]